MQAKVTRAAGILSIVSEKGSAKATLKARHRCLFGPAALRVLRLLHQEREPASREGDRYTEVTCADQSTVRLICAQTPSTGSGQAETMHKWTRKQRKGWRRKGILWEYNGDGRFALERLDKFWKRCWRKNPDGTWRELKRA